MQLVKPSVEILAAYGHDHLPMTYDDPAKMIEFAGRTCYQSFDRAWDECPECGGRKMIDTPPGGWRDCPTCQGGMFKNSAEKFVDMLTRRGHYAMLEHNWIVCALPLEDSAPESNFLFCDGEYVAGNLRAFQEAGYPTNFQMRPAAVVGLPPWRAAHLMAMTARIVCDRGVTHEIVRHRPASYAQESTRYCNYGGGVTFVIPPWVEDVEPGEYPQSKHTLDIVANQPWDTEEKQKAGYASCHWVNSMMQAEDHYLNLLELGQSPQQARSVLPNSLKTEIVITASLAEWQHIFKLRCDKAAHPQMREVMIPLRDQARELYPGVFAA